MIKNNSGFVAAVGAIQESVIDISKKAVFLGLSDLGAETGDLNVHDEFVRNFDRLANKLFKERLGNCGYVKIMASEEEEQPIVLDAKESDELYVVFFDPLDGSSNITANITLGSVFSIYPYNKEKSLEENFLPNLRSQIFAGYAMYSMATVTVVTDGGKVSESIYSPPFDMFLRANDSLQMPQEGEKIYSINESNFWRWNNIAVTMFINRLKNVEGYSTRWVGTLVADFHRTLKQGGVFLYPGDSNNQNGKLRLMYEAAPLSFLIERAGGMAIHENGTPILDLKPKGIHQKVPFIFGGRKEVEMYKESLESASKTC